MLPRTAQMISSTLDATAGTTSTDSTISVLVYTLGANITSRPTLFCNAATSHTYRLGIRCARVMRP